MKPRTCRERRRLLTLKNALVASAFLLLASGSVHAADTPASATMAALESVFDDPHSAPTGLGPGRCATSLIRNALAPDSGLDPADREQLRSWLRPETLALRAGGQTHLSAQGRFEIEYWVTGVDSVPDTDTSPANGIPDYVEWVAGDLEQSWTTEVDGLGFDAPATGGLPYQVQLRAIGSYGYTELDSMAPGGTRIVLRNNYEGVPPNDDPDGPERGAMRVTAAHEFRHACQYATSAWSEPGLWVELDATWMEDEVYDDVNDYYRFLETQSPISDPPLPLDNGGSGSYAECVLQHWMAQNLGVGIILEFWERRRTNPGEEVLASYDAVLAGHGLTFLDNFVEFATYNLQTGSRARAGFGYDEASGYPDAGLAADVSALPARFGTVVEHLAAKFYRISSLPAGSDLMQLRIRQPDGAKLRFAAVIERSDGSRVVEPLTVDTVDSTVVLGTPTGDTDALYVVVTNGESSGPVAWFYADIETVPVPPPAAVPEFDMAWTTLDLGPDQVRELTLHLSNTAPPASQLAWQAWAVDDPMAAPRTIAGSQLQFDRLDYVPGDQREFSIGILNGSSSFEYLAEVKLTLPPGVDLVSGTDFVSEIGFLLTYQGLIPDTSIVDWIDPDGGFGSVAGGQTALGTVTLQFDPSLTGPVVLDWTLEGDGFGMSPHEVLGQTVLDGPATPRLEIVGPEPMPVAVSGDAYPVAWIAGDPGPVDIELSRDDGQNWETLVSGATNDGAWNWNVTGPAADSARLRVKSGPEYSPASAVFPILEPVGFATLIPSSGLLAGGTGVNVQLQVDSTGLPVGDHPILIRLYDATGISLDLPILVRVASSVVDAPPQARTRVLGISPNPFNPATELRFELAQRGHVELSILDLRGRQIRRVHAGTLEAGPQRLRWDGRDDSGREVGSGIYLYRLDTKAGVFSGKLSLVR
jgi:hypothetical protein